MGWPAGQMWLFGVWPSPVCQRTRSCVSCGPDWRTEARRQDSASFTRRVLCLALDLLLFPGGGQDHGETGSGGYSWLT